MAIVSPTDHRPTYISSLGLPLSNGRLYAFSQGTDDEKALFSDEALTTPVAHPVQLDDAGRSDTQLFCEDGQYTFKTSRFVGTDPLTAPDNDWVPDNSWDQDGNDAVVAPVVTEITTVATIADLRLVDPSDFIVADVQGYYAATDCYVRRYLWNAVSASADNYGSVIQSSVVGSGRWILQQEGDCVDVRSFGMIPGLTSTYNSQLIAMEADCAAKAVKAIYFPAGNYRFAGALSQNMRVKPIIEQGVTFYNTVGSTNVLLNIQADYEIRLTAGIKHASSVGAVRFTFNSSANTDDVRALWFGHVNGTDDHSSIAADIAASVGVSHKVVLENALNVFTMTGALPIRLKTVGQGQLNVSHDPSGNNYRVELYSVDMQTANALKLTYPNVLSVDYLQNSRLRASWFDNSSALTDWGAMLQDTGIHHAATTYPTLLLDDTIKLSTGSMTTNSWTIVAEGGLMDVRADGVMLPSIQAGGVPLFHSSSLYPPTIGCPVLGAWWKKAGCSTNQTVGMAITAASTGGGIEVDFSGCGAMTGYNMELVIENAVRIRGLDVTGSGDLRPQSNTEILDCSISRTSGAGAGEGVITLTGAGDGVGKVVIDRSTIRAVGTFPAITHSPDTLIINNSTIASSGDYAIEVSAAAVLKLSMDNCSVESGIYASALSTKISRCSFSLQNSTDIELFGNVNFSDNKTNISVTINGVSAAISGVVVSGNEFTPYSVTSPAIITLKANQAATVVHGTSITDNVFRGSLTSRTVMIVEEIAGGASWHGSENHTLVVSGNVTASSVGSSAELVVPATRGSSAVFITQKTIGPRQRVYFQGTRHDAYPDLYRNRFFYLTGTEASGYLHAAVNDNTLVTTSQINTWVQATLDADGYYFSYAANTTSPDNENMGGFAMFDIYTSGGSI